MKNFNIGMVGNGFIADWHINAFKQNNEAKIIGMCHLPFGDENRKNKGYEQLINKCNEYNIKPYPSFESMVEATEIDALIIGSINHLHYSQIITAIENGKHLLVEKPVVTEFDELKDIVKLSAKKKVKVFPAHNFLYRNAVLKAKEIIESGKLGQIIHSSFISNHTISKAHASGWRTNKQLSKGGTLMDSGHHLVYQSLYLLGSPFKIQAFSSKMVLKNMDCEDNAQVSLLYTDGSMSTIQQSWTTDMAQGVNGIRIFGTDGNIIISDALYYNGEKIDSDIKYEDSFINQAKAFSNYILHDVAPVSTLSDVYKTLKIIYGAYKSADNDSIIYY